MVYVEQMKDDELSTCTLRLSVRTADGFEACVLPQLLKTARDVDNSSVFDGFQRVLCVAATTLLPNAACDA